MLGCTLFKAVRGVPNTKSCPQKKSEFIKIYLSLLSKTVDEIASIKITMKNTKTSDLFCTFNYNLTNVCENK